MATTLGEPGVRAADIRPGLVARVRAWLPRGGALPDEDWTARHRAITGLLVAHSLGLALFGITRGFPLAHLLVEASIPLLCALAASTVQGSRSLKAGIATFGLVASSGILVHLSGGTIEAHFHFFIMLAVISLYEEWRAFLMAITFVALHHGVVGVLDPASVYNHASAVDDPWTWAFIHALFVLAESVALVVAWKFSERAHDRATSSARQLLAEEQRRLDEQARAQEILARREAQLEEAQRLAKLGSWELDLAANEVHCSSEFLSIFGLRPEQTILPAEAFHELIGEEDRAALREALERSLQGAPYSMEFDIVRPDGGHRCILASGKVVTHPDGSPRALMGTCQDITDRKTLESQLVQARKMEAVGQLAGGVAHDFNNLLSIVTTYGEFIKMQLDEGHPARDDAEKIITAGERGARLTRQLLSFSRKEVAQPRVLDVNELVQDAEDLMSRAIREDIRLTTKLCEDLWLTEVDPGEIEQVLINLTINAKDAMPLGGELMIETNNVVIDETTKVFGSEVPHGEHVLIQVSDSGTGMSKEVQARLFEPFFTTKTLGKGTGLGLATVYAIVKRAGGMITVYSEPGIGSTFKVYLPRSRELASETPAPAGSEQSSGRGETILVAEDEVDVLEATVRILESNGYNVLKAHDGREALEILGSRTGAVDLLITDVIMPDVSGRDLAHRANVTTLYISGYTNELVAQQGILGEGEVLLQKPFTGAQLLGAVDDALKAAVQR